MARQWRQLQSPEFIQPNQSHGPECGDEDLHGTIGKLQIGLWCSLCSPVAAEIVSHSGFDWLLLDTEHSPNDVPDILLQLQAAQAGTASCIVRPAWNDMVLIKRYLDIGAQTLLLPFVQTPEEAKRAVEWTRYPPKGVRGITIFDTPGNLRYPTSWHVRAYGLMGANCFGWKYFGEKDYNKPLLPAPTGDYDMKKGEKLTFKYRVYVHSGDVKEAGVADRYAVYTKPPAVSWVE